MSKYIFIIFRDNNDKTKFEIIVSRINDYRKKTSIIIYQYNKYLKYGGTYKPIYSLVSADFSSYCCYRGDFNNVEEIRDKLDELNEFYKNKFNSNI